MERKWLLMWLLFGFIKGNRTGVCPLLPPTEFADVTADMYPPETKLYYTCDPGYDREASAYPGIQCKIEQQVLGFFSIHRGVSPPCVTWYKTNLDFCGPPKTIPHASIRLPQQHYVGQVLHFKCQTGYDKRPPTFGSRTCKEVNGKTFWTPLDMRCTNDSTQWPPQTIEPGKMHQPITIWCLVFFIMTPLKISLGAIQIKEFLAVIDTALQQSSPRK
uniref:Interleukin-2 receptor subunit alpha n=1 Tax=Geospiza parvula TaxID=87175 RepID=A0A8U8BF09_GEOPR